MKKPFTHFDLPKQHLVGDHYVPARARHADEIERRRSLPCGTVLLEQQRDGLAIAHHIAEHVDDDRDLQYVSDMLAASALNASWYGFAQHAPVMRRRLYLPELASDDNEWRETRSGLLAKVRQGLAETAELAGAVTAAKVGGYETKRQSFELGRLLGNNALRAGCVTIGNATYGLNAYEAQLAARDQSLVMLERSRTLTSEVGVNVSIAQLADRDSPLSVHVRRTAPDGVYNALEEAIEEQSYAA
ncbi:MAG: hypothetical protein JWM00_803 [Candidatus Saccharibacteria bacterium]|nr:hypothetical protein [Candidatus Saccharibacteria bacterium]